ncbi:phytanoyl-CoA dioxygenase [Ceratobasidium sp. AG-Ba]|nr:phytanoyl-CoA dioxygenase [Ceratobasidium sp. AG-Ba]
MSREYKYLTPEQVDFFMNHGYVVIKKALKEEWIERATHDVWIRLGVDPNDKSTWKSERVNQPWHRRVMAKDVAPAAWGAICEIVGGEERIADYCKEWRDGLITNMGSDEWETKDISPRELDNCDIKASPRGGGTYIAEDGVGVIARWLRDHPEGVLPGLGPGQGKFDFLARINECNVFTEMTGERGDVILLHPLMLHSASKNHTRAVRLITNPPVSLKEPFNFNRENPADFSLVELKTLKELGVDRYNFVPSVPRQQIVPKRLDAQTKILAEELERMKANAAKTGIPIDSEHANVHPDKLRESLSPPMVKAS